MKRGKNELPSRDVAFFCTIALSGDGVAHGSRCRMRMRAAGSMISRHRLRHESLSLPYLPHLQDRIFALTYHTLTQRVLGLVCASGNFSVQVNSVFQSNNGFRWFQSMVMSEINVVGLTSSVGNRRIIS